MKLIIDTDNNSLTVENNDKAQTIALYSKEAFEIVSQYWLKIGWNQKHIYTFTWMGRPIIQLPEDLIRIQEVIYKVKPDVIVESGIAHGGSLVYYASLFKTLEKGRVIGVDIEIRPHNRKAIENHELYPLITLIEGDAIAPDTVTQVKSLIQPGEKVMVVLDSCHTKQHVLKELEAYHDLVTPGSYIVATDGILEDLDDVPRGNPEWKQSNPKAAAAEFLKSHPEFLLKQPQWLFNESELTDNITHWPGAWLYKQI
ncbi:cephalosporin hydroxylase family protein [Gloeocapsa sp. PCC 73106]|uniref:cephalosporin hydroxylase family protein n=1 Tax=Gloeocapsa sp. PCC 73106 TaxID=102232 RepID=UPI0002ABDC18|nr:CmcI family methyltransferase [Gloeocapsa sp. PCC 73106]ELR98316.1 cephalosporin hydroxylase [Gloeocapsa sp. PCC 73106]